MQHYRQTASAVGADRAVIVQPAAYGSDNGVLLEALAEWGPDRSRGVVTLGDEPPSSAALDEWERAGVRGLRTIGFPAGTRAHSAHEPSAHDGDLIGATRRSLARDAEIARERGWHLDLLLPNDVFVTLAPMMAELDVDVVLAHLALAPAAAGVGQPGFRALIELLSQTDRCWVKLTAPYRISAQPGWGDVDRFVLELLTVRPDRVVWGSDHPHLSFTDAADPVGTASRMFDLAGDDATRELLFVDNPARLYGFTTGEPRG